MTQCENCYSELNRSELDSDYPICPDCGSELGALPHSEASTVELQSTTSDNRKPVPPATPAKRSSAENSPDNIDLSAVRSLASGVEVIPSVTGLEIVGVIGRGGMGCVYEAKQLSLGGRRVAVKHLPDRLAKSPHFTSRFRQEAEALARLSHPNIVAVFDFQTAGNSVYLIMEYVAGPEGKPADLTNLIGARQVDVETTKRLIQQVLSALNTAHQEGIVHRDIKPGNIMLDRHGSAKVVDFGLASVFESQADRGLTVVGKAMGTVDYMSPEQSVDASSVDARTDIYSVGVLLYQMLTGRLPKGAFRRPSELVAGISPQWDRIIDKALQQDPTGRYQTALEMLSDVASLDGQGKDSVGEAIASLKRAEDRSLSLDSRLQHSQHALQFLDELRHRDGNGQLEETEVSARQLAKELSKKCGEIAEQNQNFSAALRHYSFLAKLVPNSNVLKQRLDELEQHRQKLVQKAAEEFRSGEFQRALRTLDIAVQRYPEDSQLRKMQSEWTVEGQRLEEGAQQVLKLRSEKRLFALQTLLQDLCSEATGRKCFGKLKEQIDNHISQIWKEVQVLQALLRNGQHEQLEEKLERLNTVVTDCPEVNQLRDSLGATRNSNPKMRRYALGVGTISVLIVAAALTLRFLFPDTWQAWRGQMLGMFSNSLFANAATASGSPATGKGQAVSPAFGNPNQTGTGVANDHSSGGATTTAQPSISQLFTDLSQSIDALDALLAKGNLASARSQLDYIRELLHRVKNTDPQNFRIAAFDERIEESEEVLSAGESLMQLLDQLDTIQFDAEIDIAADMLMSAKQSLETVKASKWPLAGPDDAASRIASVQGKLDSALEGIAMKQALVGFDQSLNQKKYLDAKKKLEQLPRDLEAVRERWDRFNAEFLANSGKLQIELVDAGLTAEDIERLETRIAGEFLTPDLSTDHSLTFRWLPGRHSLQLTLDAQRHFTYVTIKQGEKISVQPRLRTPANLATLGPHRGTVQTVRISPDGKTSAATISGLDFLQFNLATKVAYDLNKVFREKHGKELYSIPGACDFSPDGQFFAVEWRESGDQHSHIKVRDAGNYDRSLAELVTADPNLDIGLLRVSRGAKFVAGWDSRNQRVLIWDTRQNNYRNVSDYAKGISTLNFNADGTGLLVGNADPNLPIDFFTYPQNEVARTKQFRGLEHPCADIVHAAANGEVIGAGGSVYQSECQVVVWDFDSAAVESSVRFPLEQRFQSVRLTRGGEYAFVGTQGGTIEVFDIGMRKRLDLPVLTIGSTSQAITAIDVSADGRHLLAGDSKGVVHYMELPIELTEYAVDPPKPLPTKDESAGQKDR